MVLPKILVLTHARCTSPTTQMKRKQTRQADSRHGKAGKRNKGNDCPPWQAEYLAVQKEMQAGPSAGAGAGAAKAAGRGLTKTTTKTQTKTQTHAMPCHATPHHGPARL